MAGEETQPFSNSEAPEVPKKNRGLLHVPSRSSSHKIQPSPTSTGLSGATASDPNDSIGRRSKESRSSVIGKRRNGSVASSKKSVTSPVAVEGNAARAGPAAAQSGSGHLAKKPKGFLSFLNCCGAPDQSNGLELDETAVPMKKVTKVSSLGRPTTASKPGPSNTDSAAGRPTAQQSEKETLKLPQPVPITGTNAEAASSSTLRDDPGANSSGVLARQPSAKAVRDQPLPDLPHESEKAAADQSAKSSSSPALFVEAPAPVAKDEVNNTSPQTSSSESKDVTMGDAPLPTQVETKAGSNTQAAPRTKSSDLPPPPPLPAPDSNQNSSSPAGTSATVDTPEEKQQWLLPPIEPRFHGKKCLVLDLDETLVHSSFKVYIYIIHFVK